MGLKPLFRQLLCAVFGHKEYSYPMISYPPSREGNWRVWVWTSCVRCKHVLRKEATDQEYTPQWH